MSETEKTDGGETKKPMSEKDRHGWKPKPEQPDYSDIIERSKDDSLNGVP